MNKKTVTDVDKAVGLNVRDRRRQMNLTQQDLGKLVGITFQQVQKYERGVNRITIGRLVSISEALECNITDLVPVRAKKGVKAMRSGVDFKTASRMSARLKKITTQIDAAIALGA